MTVRVTAGCGLLGCLVLAFALPLSSWWRVRRCWRWARRCTGCGGLRPSRRREPARHGPATRAVRRGAVPLAAPEANGWSVGTISLAEGQQGDRDQLEVGDAQRDADDRDAQGDAGDDVAEGQPPAGEDQPQHVADAGGRARVAAVDGGVAEGPEGVDADAERGDAEGDADDGDAQQQSRRACSRGTSRSRTGSAR